MPSKQLKVIQKLADRNKYGTVAGTRMNGKTAKEIVAIYDHPKMKKFRSKMDKMKSHELMDLTIKLPRVLKIKVEGFGGELKGKDKEKFEKARKENAEVLGYKLTGKSDIRESWNQLRTNLMSILKRKQHQKIDGVLVDMQTANLILKVWDALNSSNRKKFEKLSIKKMADVAWKLMK